jgi:hypothetical protein
MTRRFLAAGPLAAALVLLATAPALAGEVEKKADFELDRWIELESTDGPVTLHRFRIVRASGTKSRILRPGNSEYLEDVQLQLEFSNDASRDWEARFDVVWSDASGNPIDGYHDSENLDNDSRHDQQTVTLSTLRYGLEHAKRLSVRIRYDPD